ncbi:MAG: PLP-dependent aminotransferase family protein [Oceanospirillales bacterium]|nr:PLP-dependent aminotransferase family protein [Oceanospirillales bacterium]
MRYKQMADQIIADIESGRLPGNSRLPSLRKSARLYSVSMTTAINCYHYLEELGWLIAKPQSGFYVSQPAVPARPPGLPRFESRITTPHMPSTAGGMNGPLGISQLGPSLLPTAALNRSVKRALRHSSEYLERYPDPQGEAALRQALASHFAGYGFPFAASELVIGNGCIDAVRVALELTTQPGDAVAISSPCFNGLLELLALLDRRVVEIPSTAEGIDLEQLEHHLSRRHVKAGLFSTTHMNPQGISMTPRQKQKLADLAETYATPIIEDDIYMELGHGNITPLPAKYWDRSGYILWCGSVSKTLSAGLRIGWCLPGRYLERYRQHRSVGHFGLNALSQAALADFIGTGQYHAHLQKVRALLKRQISAYQSFLQNALADNIALSHPSGGLVLWLQSPGLNCTELNRRAREIGLGIRPGCEFTTLSLYQDCLRINAGWPLDYEQNGRYPARDALQQLIGLIQHP